MKYLTKTFIFAFLLSLSLVTGYSDAQIRKTPETVLANFASMYPNAGTVNWEDRLTYFLATFDNDGTPTMVQFSNNGNWRQTEAVISEDDLPDEVNDGFEKSKYAAKEINAVSLLTFPDKEKQYKLNVSGDSVLDKWNLYFSAKGRLIKDNRSL